MSWFKVDDRLHAHPKWLALPKGARALWITAGSWSSAQHLLGFEGSRGYVVAYRDATLEEIANAEQAQEQARLLRTEHRVRRVRLSCLPRRSSCGAGSTTKRPRPPEGERGHVKAGCV